MDLPGGSWITPNNQLGGATHVFNFPNYVGSKQELMNLIRNEAQRIKQRSGRQASARRGGLHGPPSRPHPSSAFRKKTTARAA